MDVSEASIGEYDDDIGFADQRFDSFDDMGDVGLVECGNTLGGDLGDDLLGVEPVFFW